MTDAADGVGGSDLPSGRTATVPAAASRPMNYATRCPQCRKAYRLEKATSRELKCRNCGRFFEVRPGDLVRLEPRGMKRVVKRVRELPGWALVLLLAGLVLGGGWFMSLVSGGGLDGSPEAEAYRTLAAPLGNLTATLNRLGPDDVAGARTELTGVTMEYGAAFDTVKRSAEADPDLGPALFERFGEDLEGDLDDLTAARGRFEGSPASAIVRRTLARVPTHPNLIRQALGVPLGPPGG